jgi:4-amino-4-deoxy-L-arabinose transferase-like glycosyltransferase
VLGTAWCFATAPLNGPDENAHVSYIQHLAETGHIPHADSGTHSDSTEVENAQVILGLHAMRFWPYAKANWTKADVQRFHDFTRDPAFRKNGDGPTPVARTPPLYYALEAIVYRLTPSSDLLHRLVVLRLFDVPLAMLTVLFTWLGASLLFRQTWLRTLAAAMVALHPQLQFMTGVVNPDSLLFTLYAAGIWLGLRVIQRGPTPASAAVLMGVCTAAAATQGRGIPMIPAGLLAIALGWLQFRTDLRRTLRIAAAGAAPLLVIGAMTYVITRSAASTGGAYGGEATLGGAPLSVRQFGSYVWQFYFKAFTFMSPPIYPGYGYRQLYIERLFGVFGSLEIIFSTVVYDAIQLAAGFGLILLFGSVVAAWRSEIAPRWREAVFLAVVGLLSVFLLHLAAYRNMLNVPSDPLLVGRYLVPLLPLFGFAVAVAVRGLGRRLGPVLAGVLMGSGVILSFGSLGITLVRYWG